MMAIETVGSPGLWAAFIGFVILMLALDLGVFHRKAHAISFKEAGVWSVVWISLALLFGGWVWWRFGPQLGMEYLTGYLIEKSLSVDNIFVFVVIFSSMAIPAIYQHRVLFWGILTALILRAVMIFAGAAALERFHWLIYVFGLFLVVTGIKLFFTWKSHAEESPEGSRIMGLLRRFIPSTPRLNGQHFFVVENGRRLATPLFMALMLVELSDVLFALDSIPAIFAVTRDPFIVFTSNIFAILGLRSLFFLLAGMMDKFTYLKPGLSAVLVFVGVKMMIVDFVKIPSVLSLAIIGGLLAGAVVASLIHARRHPPAGPGPQPSSA